MATQVTLNSGSVDSAGSLALKTNGTTTAVTIDTSQNVGIGTSSPLTPLHVVGAIQSQRTGGVSQYARMVNSGGTATFISDNQASGTYTGFQFQGLSTASGTPTTYATIDGNGNVGIGTTSPTGLLDVYKAAQGGTNTFRAYGPAGQILWANGGASTSYLDSDTTIFRQSSASGNAERMRIDSSGNVGIGTSSPSNKLHVESASAESVRIGYSSTKTARLGVTSGGNLQVYAFDSTAVSYTNILLAVDGSTVAGNVLVGTTNTEPRNLSSGSGIKLGNGGIEAAGSGDTNFINITSASGNMLSFRRQANSVGTISTNGTTTTYGTSSDYRLKENIAPMTGALEKVALLKPCTYVWKATGEADEGFIAHELAEVCPSAVQGEKDAVDAEGNPVYQGIDTSFLVATLTAAIKEQQAIITQLQADVAALKGTA